MGTFRFTKILAVVALAASSVISAAPALAAGTSYGCTGCTGGGGSAGGGTIVGVVTVKQVVPTIITVLYNNVPFKFTLPARSTSMGVSAALIAPTFNYIARGVKRWSTFKFVYYKGSIQNTQRSSLRVHGSVPVPRNSFVTVLDRNSPFPNVLLGKQYQSYSSGMLRYSVPSASTFTVFTSSYSGRLQFGNRGALVAALQHLLRNDGFTTPITGVFDRKTLSKLAAAQRYFGIVPNGRTYTEVWEYLEVR